MASSEPSIEGIADDVIRAASSQRGADCSDKLRDAFGAIAEHHSREEERLLRRAHAARRSTGQ